MRCLSVTFVHSVKTNTHYLQNFSLLGSQAILVFPYKTAWQYSNRNPITGAWNAGGRNRDSELISGFTACCHAATGQLLSTRRRKTTVPQVVTLIACSKRPSWLMSGNNDKVYDKKSQRYAKDNRTAFIPNRTQ